MPLLLKKPLKISWKQRRCRYLEFIFFFPPVHFLTVDSVRSRHLWIATLDDAFTSKTKPKMKYRKKSEEISRETNVDEFTNMSLLIYYIYLFFLNANKPFNICLWTVFEPGTFKLLLYRRKYWWIKLIFLHEVKFCLSVFWSIFDT